MKMFLHNVLWNTYYFKLELSVQADLEHYSKLAYVLAIVMFIIPT